MQEGNRFENCVKWLNLRSWLDFYQWRVCRYKFIPASNTHLQYLHSLVNGLICDSIYFNFLRILKLLRQLLPFLWTKEQCVVQYKAFTCESCYANTFLIPGTCFSTHLRLQRARVTTIERKAHNSEKYFYFSFFPTYVLILFMYSVNCINHITKKIVLNTH